MYRFFLAMLFGWACVCSSTAQTLNILTENDAPAQFEDSNGDLTGYTIEIVHGIQKRVGNTDPIHMVPWARGYRTIERQSNVVLFLMARTAERNALFQWVGPVLEVEFGLFAKADSVLHLGSLEDAKKINRIGVYRDDARDQMLTQAGFTNLERVSNNVINVKKLMGGRLDAYAASTSSYGFDAVEAGYKPSDLKLVLSLSTTQLYIAMSKDMPLSVVDDWNDALRAMRRDGTLTRLLAKYYPQAKLPGPAITRF